MTPVVVLLLSILVSFVIVRVGAVAFELTGMPWTQAKFQALSTFTNTGFTTRESEEITRHPVRRRVASILIVLGNAGLVAVVGSFAGSLITPQPAQTLTNLGLILGGLSLLVWIGHGRWVGQRLRRATQSWLDRRYQLSQWSPHDLLHLDEGYALTRFVVDEDSPALNRELASLQLKDHLVQILAIERAGEFLPIPRGVDRLYAGDSLIVYGRATSIEHLFEPSETSSLELTESDEPIDATASADGS